jgi:hypothetical protein
MDIIIHVQEFELFINTFCKKKLFRSSSSQKHGNHKDQQKYLDGQCFALIVPLDRN